MIQSTSPAPEEGEEPADADESASPELSLGADIISFAREVDSLGSTLPLAMLAIRQVNRSATKALRDYESKHCEVREDGAKRTVTLTEETQHEFYKLFRSFERGNRAFELVPRSFLVALVSQFDSYLGALLRQLFLLQPKRLQASQRTLNLSELMEFGSIEAARDHILEKEIETVLRLSHAEQFDWLEKQFDLPLRKNLAAWPPFIELTERRNLFVHASGRVSQQYLAVCSKHGVTLPKEVQKGTVLDAAPKYFEEARRCVSEIGIKLGQVLWRKVAPEQLDLADSNLIALSYELIADEQYAFAVVLLDFATETLKKHASEVNRRTFVINRAQAYKWLGDQARANAILDAEDWSASADRFALCAAVIREDIDLTLQLVARIGRTGEVRKSDYRDWPVFRRLREEDRFRAEFRKIFGEELATRQVRTEGGQDSAPPAGT